MRVYVHETRLEVYLGGVHQVSMDRVRGRGAFNVSWRHMVGWMSKKPGAFRRFRYRDALFPTATFRRAWEALDASLATWSADMNYLQILKLALGEGQAQVEPEIQALLDAGALPRFDAVKERMKREATPAPDMLALEVNIDEYDELTPEVQSEVSR